MTDDMAVEGYPWNRPTVGGGYPWYYDQRGVCGSNSTTLECVELQWYRMWGYHRDEGKGKHCDDRRE